MGIPFFFTQFSFNFRSSPFNFILNVSVLELTADEMASLDEEELTKTMASVDILIGELLKSPKDIWNSITAVYSELYLDRYYILAMRARIPKVRMRVWRGTRAYFFWSARPPMCLANTVERRGGRGGCSLAFRHLGHALRGISGP